MIKEVKNYKLPFKMEEAKDFREKPKIVGGKRLIYSALELGIGSAMELQKIPSKYLPPSDGRNIKQSFKTVKRR